ncbi:hypothetical protein OAP78_01710 [Candidatus Pelagibacter sp.]|nr:hypothetical protein [Candidatus Pelagibacter sp.]
MKNLNNNNIIKYLLIYWLLLVVAQVFFHPFTSGRFVDKATGGMYIERWIEWGTLFNFAIFIPLVVVAIIKIIQFKK